MDRLKKLISSPTIAQKQFYATMITLTIVELSGAVTCLVDGLVISRFIGPTAMAAFGLTGVYFSICAVISFTLAAGVQAMCTAYISKGDITSSSRAFTIACLIAVVSGALMTVFGIIFAGPFARLLGAEGELYPLTTAYFRGAFIGTIPNILLAVLAPLVQLDGAGRTAQLSSLLVIVCDIVFDLLNALVLHLGLLGMGCATSLSYIIAFIPYIRHFLSKNTLFKRHTAGIKAKECLKLIGIGLPRGVSMLSRALGPIFINLYVLSIASTVGMTAMSVQSNMRFLLCAPAWGISGAVLLLGSVYVGEIDKVNLRRTLLQSINCVIVFMIPLSIIFALGAPIAVKLYLSTSDAAFNMSVEALRAYAISLPLIGLNLCAGAYLQAIGRKADTYIYSLSNEFIGIVIVVYIMGHFFGIRGVWFAFPVWQLILLSFYLIIMMRIHSPDKGLNKLLLLNYDFESTIGKALEGHVKTVEDAVELSEKMRKFCLDEGVDESNAMHLALCVEEVCTNIITNAFKENKNKGLIDARVFVNDELLSLRIRDNCPLFTMKKRVSSYRTNRNHPERNVSTGVVMKMADEITFTNTLETNCVSIRIYRDAEKKKAAHPHRAALKAALRAMTGEQE